MPESPPPEPEPEEITLEEWIAATQSCCGIEPESRRKPKPAASAPPADAVPPDENATCRVLIHRTGDAPQP